ncbi:helix-turn-helix transcriptional regulator [Streptomyces sp. MBT27]|uniref:helix-turn-helix domain-containing protein n=1 Tax=Streptomyces sp. MBT27 TaxID=1488356 RepID=UPI00142330E2|nr:helix-turn-helix transcriptional regulator [Streptomyces sp. MBT27]
MAQKVGPTIRRIQLGRELKRLRESRGLTLEQAADGMPFDKTRVSKLEGGTTKLRTSGHLRSLLGRYGLTEEEDIEFLITMHTDSLSQEWWSPYRSVMPSGMQLYVGLEEDAKTMRVWQPAVVFGLFQTKEYARAQFEAAKPVDERTTEFVEWNVQLRIERQEIVTRTAKPPAELFVVLDEAALRRNVGGAQIMRVQYERISELSELDHVTVQILPMSVPTYRADSNFSLLDFDEPQMTIVEVDVPAGVSVADKDTEVWKYRRRFDALQRGALGPGETPKFLERLAKELTH